MTDILVRENVACRYKCELTDKLKYNAGYAQFLCPVCGTTLEWKSDSDEKGTKHDKEKPLWNLLPYKPVSKVVDVLTFGATKYTPDNWKKVPDARNRYFAATMRHITAWWGGETKDPESGIHHLAHAVCCLLFLMWFDEKETTNVEKCAK